MAADTPPSYTTQNFDAVNDYIGHLAARHHARTARWRSDTIGTYLKWGAVLIAAAGVAAFFVLWGLSLWRNETEIKIVEPVVVDRDVTIILDERLRARDGRQEGAVEPIVRQAEKRIDALKAGGVIEPTAGRTVIDFVIFKNLDFNRDGLSTVVVGMKYKDASATEPSSQWCYVNKGNLSGNVTRVDLADKIGDQLNYRDITLSQAREARTTVLTLKAAQRLCVFN